MNVVRSSECMAMPDYSIQCLCNWEDGKVTEESGGTMSTMELTVMDQHTG